jgi:hypothetical protein
VLSAGIAHMDNFGPVPWKYETVSLGPQHSDEEECGISVPVAKRKVVGQ